MNADTRGWTLRSGQPFSVSQFSSVLICVYLCFNLVGCSSARVEKLTIDGEPAYKLTDGKVEAIIEPAKRRVMSFRRVNGENLFHVNPDAKPGKPGEQVSYGGSFAWLWPQEKWNGGRADWPPPMDVEGATFRAGVDSSNIRIASDRVAESGGNRVFEHITLVDRSRLSVGTGFMDNSDAGRPSPVGWAVWRVTQVVPPDAIFARLARDGVYGATALPPFNAGQLLGLRLVEGRVFQINRGGDSARKAGFDADRLAAWYEATGTLLLLEQHIIGPGEFRRGERAQVYTDTNLVELEFTAPIAQEGAKPASLVVIYSIHRASTREDAVRVVASN